MCSTRIAASSLTNCVKFFLGVGQLPSWVQTSVCPKPVGRMLNDFYDKLASSLVLVEVTHLAGAMSKVGPGLRELCLGGRFLCGLCVSLQVVRHLRTDSENLSTKTFIFTCCIT